jgi:hypothetical protein
LLPLMIYDYSTSTTRLLNLGGATQLAKVLRSRDLAFDSLFKNSSPLGPCVLVPYSFTVTIEAESNELPMNRSLPTL